jgi:hypothetical protein
LSPPAPTTPEIALPAAVVELLADNAQAPEQELEALKKLPATALDESFEKSKEAEIDEACREKYPLMSIRRCVPDTPALTEIAPIGTELPAGTMTAFAMVCPAVKLIEETVGSEAPVGQITRCPGPDGVTTVTFKEYASMLFGIPGHGPFSRSNLRSTPGERLGGPNPAGNVPTLVSTSRQGATPMNARGEVTSVMVVMPPEECA